MLIIRASDGSSFRLYKSDFNGISTLTELRFNILSPLLSIPPESLICMNEEGAQLREDNVPQLAILTGSPSNSPDLDVKLGSQGNIERTRERRLYVFDREHLDADPEEMAFHLAITEDQVLQEPELGPEDPLLSHIHLSQHNLTTLHALLSSLAFQRDSLSLALSNLQRVMTGTTTSLSLFLESNSSSIDGWNSLLESWELNMVAITKVSVITGLIGRSNSGVGVSLAATATIVKEKERFLGDYVSRDKMVAVKDGCQKVLEELMARIEAVQTTLAEVLEGTEIIRVEFEESSNADLELCEHDAEDGHAKVQELVRIGLELNDEQLRAENYEELFHLDQDSRDRIRFLVDRKNAVTRYLVISMQRISALQSTIASMPADLGTLDHELRTRTDNFKHLARLEGMIPAYIATVVEVVRRRLFTRLISGHADSVSSTLSPLSLAEKTRRSLYRANYSGKLPWEVKGLGIGSEENLPQVEFQAGGLDELPDLDRPSLDSLQKNFTDLEELLIAEVEIDGPIKRAKRLLDNFVVEIDQLEKQFANLSNEIHTEGPALDARVASLEDQLRIAEESNEFLSRQLQTERTAAEEDKAQLNQKNTELVAHQERQQSQLVKLEDDLISVETIRAQQDLREKDWKLEKEHYMRKLQEATAVTEELTENNKKVEIELGSKITELEGKLSVSKLASEELARSVLEVEDQQTKLQSRYSELEVESTRTKATLQEVETRLEVTEIDLKESNLEIQQKDRALRDFKNESSFDHAGLEQEITELKSLVTHKEEEIVAGAKESLRLESVTIYLKEELNCVEKESARISTELEEEKLQNLSHVEEKQKLVETSRNALKIAGEITQENLKIVSYLALSATPTKPESTPLEVLPEVSTPFEPSLDFIHGDLDELLLAVSNYIPDSITEAVNGKVESLTILMKKWQRECKAYREKAHRAVAIANEKIAFRNFAKGDLALFLPTRNSTAQIWAAFNVSAPHHFLSATGVVAEQIKSREWIVARIVNMEEKIVDSKEPASNQFLLAPGTKFFLLEVEGWSSKQSPSTRNRKSSMRSEERKVSGHSRISRSESSARPVTAPAGLIASSTVLVEHSETIRRASEPEVTFQQDLARSEFSIIPEEVVTKSTSVEELQALPSALSISLSRIPESTRSDPFTSPFSVALQAEDSFSKSPSPPSTTFEASVSNAGDIPAFLPSNKLKNSRYGKSLGLSKSPTSSDFGSDGGGGKSPNSFQGESSFLSSSLYRTSATGASSSPTPSVKGVATTSTSLKNELDLAGRWKQNSAIEVDSSRTMTIGRSAKGYGESVSIIKSPSIMDTLAKRRNASTSTAPNELTASEILKTLK